MQEEEKQRLRDLKQCAVSQLQKQREELLRRFSYALKETDPRIETYVTNVIDNPDEHNLYEVLGVQRFFSMLARYKWRKDRALHFFGVYESIKFSGVKGRRRYKLTPVQCFQFSNIYGFAREDGRRLIQLVYLFVPRKFSKTTGAASMAVYDMLFGDNNAQAYVAANSYDQAKICFDEIRNIMRDIDPREKHFKVNREKIVYKDRGRDSLISCLSANAKTKDGLFASLVIMDEYAQARNTPGKSGADLKNVLTTSMGPRREPLTVVITTASEVVDGPFVHELEGALSVLRGEIENDTVFASIFMPDVDDEEADPRTWRKVQPHLGVTVDEDFYPTEYGKALLSGENMLAFRTKLLNIFTINEQKRWFSWEKARSITGAFNIKDLPGAPYCAVAFDLSVRDDFSAVSYVAYVRGANKFYCHTDYYFPEGALPGHANEQLYRVWAAQGHLRLLPGERIDVARIAEDITAHTKSLRIIRVAYDAWKARDLVNRLASAGFSGVLHPYSQTYGSFNLPVETFEMLAYSDPPAIVLQNNPINVFCLSNCVIDTDNLENKKPLKYSNTQKIDGTITQLMGLGALLTWEH